MDLVGLSPRDPLFPGHKLQPKQIVVDAKIPTGSFYHRPRYDASNLLRHDAHELLIAPIVAVAVQGDPVRKLSHAHNVMLQADVGECAKKHGANTDRARGASNGHRVIERL